MGCAVPYPRWGEIVSPGELEGRFLDKGVPAEVGSPLAQALSDLFMEHAREEEANYEYLCGLIEGLMPAPAPARGVAFDASLPTPALYWTTDGMELADGATVDTWDPEIDNLGLTNFVKTGTHVFTAADTVMGGLPTIKPSTSTTGKFEWDIPSWSSPDFGTMVMHGWFQSKGGTSGTEFRWSTILTTGASWYGGLGLDEFADRIVIYANHAIANINSQFTSVEGTTQPIFAVQQIGKSGATAPDNTTLASFGEHAGMPVSAGYFANPAGVMSGPVNSGRTPGKINVLEGNDVAGTVLYALTDLVVWQERLTDTQRQQVANDFYAKYGDI